MVANRARVMQNSTCSSTATGAMSRPGAPRASPTVTPSRPITLASGQTPAAEAASRPTASGRARSGYGASVAGSRVASRPKEKIGRTSQANANMVNTAVASSTAPPWPRIPARLVKTAIATTAATVVLRMNPILARRDQRTALPSERSFRLTMSQATTAHPRRPPARRPGP